MTRLIIAVAGLMVAAGCASDSTGPTREGATSTAAVLPSWLSNATRVRSNDGTFQIAYRTRPSVIPLNELFDVDAAILDTDDAVVVGADLRVDARMPAHRHGMVRSPKIVRREDGTFTASGMLFHMPGHWQLHFDIERADGVIERAQADVHLD